MNEGYLHPIDKGVQPWHTLHIDHVGPLIKSEKGYRHIFEIIDAFSKFTFREAIANLRTLFKLFGTPVRIISERGSTFTSDEFKEFCTTLGIKLVLIAVRTPKANGQIERYNRVIVPAI